MTDFDSILKPFWQQSEIDSYRFPDLYYSFCSGNGSVFYPLYEEKFIGIQKRDSCTFDLQTMFVPKSTDLSNQIPSLIITVPVKKNGNSYKLCNAFTNNRSTLKSYTLSNIKYYYAVGYSFNYEQAKKLDERIKLFKQDFDISYNGQITYLTGDNLTQITKWFGIDFYEYDFLSIGSSIEGRTIPNNNMVLSGGGGENYFHEIIHMILKQYKSNRGEYPYFEEGIACYYGEHIGHLYSFHVRRLKEYLNQNKWIDLSRSLEGYYMNNEKTKNYNHEQKENIFYRYRDDNTNYIYIVHAVLCEIAFRQGGVKKVKEILLSKTDNEKEFYEIIQKGLGIQQKDMNTFIRNYINQNF
ncbi:MAG: hypothetical protein Q7U54_03865 [Bacteroidales bacterium]|nr:hypothetical protein [Bacteroidales bacterium]